MKFFKVATKEEEQTYRFHERFLNATYPPFNELKPYYDLLGIVFNST
jgi:hypothetical protein